MPPVREYGIITGFPAISGTTTDFKTAVSIAYGAPKTTAANPTAMLESPIFMNGSAGTIGGIAFSINPNRSAEASINAAYAACFEDIFFIGYPVTYESLPPRIITTMPRGAQTIAAPERDTAPVEIHIPFGQSFSVICAIPERMLKTACVPGIS